MKYLKPQKLSVLFLLLMLVGTVSAANYTLISAGKTVSASSVQTAGLEADNVNDGDNGTRWSSNFSEWEWVRIDLGSDQSVDKIVMEWEAAYATGYNIFVVKDGASSWGTPVYVENNGQGGTEEITRSFGTGRYVVIQSMNRATEYGISLFELEVYSDASVAVTWAGSSRLAPTNPEPGTVYNASATDVNYIWYDDQWNFFSPGKFSYDLIEVNENEIKYNTFDITQNAIEIADLKAANAALIARIIALEAKH